MTAGTRTCDDSSAYHVRDHNDWNLGLLDTTVNANGQLTNPWNAAGETDEERQDRKNILLILCSTSSSHNHLLNSVANGDAQNAWKALCDEFMGHTAAAFNKLSGDFSTCNQVSLDLSVAKYITKLRHEVAWPATGRKMPSCSRSSCKF